MQTQVQTYEELEHAIRTCAKATSKALSPLEALQYSQAALNIANAIVTLTTRDNCE